MERVVEGGVKRLTVCYHGNATPLRQEEPVTLSVYSVYTLPASQPPNLSLSLVHRCSCILRENEGGNQNARDTRETTATTTKEPRITPLTLFLHQSVFTKFPHATRLQHRGWYFGDSRASLRIGRRIYESTIVEHR